MRKKWKCASVSKDFGAVETNEDAALAREGVIAVSDGAGGGGVYAELWSRYLLDNLPDTPITSFDELDAWIDGIWESFYKDCEKKAKIQGGMFLNKFYDEGSFATLAAAWRVSADECRWIAYGDSVVFCYDKGTGELQHSFTHLADFNKPPYLINSKDPLDERGFCTGIFHISPSCIVFAASDALSHAILALYEASRKKDGFADFDKELDAAIGMHTRNSALVKSVLGLRRINFSRRITELTNACKDEKRFRDIIQKMKEKMIIATDDYSLAVM